MASPTIQRKQGSLLKNIHISLNRPGCQTYMVHGDYEYYHYGCDGQDDRGWGCGYRTLQSICSWVKCQQLRAPTSKRKIPNEIPCIAEIQKTLVAIGDKDIAFHGSREWIGSVEVCMCLDHLYDVPCKILHVQSGKDLCSHLEDIIDHFNTFGSPVMMGGDSDSSSKGILGVCRDPPALLVMDPHFYGHNAISGIYLQEHSWIKWQYLNEFSKHSFYNFCLPQLIGTTENDVHTH